MTQVVTGEAVQLDLRPAALPSRGLALLLDLLLQAALGLAIGITLGLLADSLDPAALAALALVAFLVVVVGYPVAFETLLRGRTPGKAALGLRVVRDDFGPIGFRQALIRGLTFGTIEGVALLFAPAVITQVATGRKRIGDLLAGTVVLRERVASAGGPVMSMPPPLGSWAAGLDLTAVSDELALSAREFLARAPQLLPGTREEVGTRLVGRVLAALRTTPPPGAPGWALLAAVLAERRRRDEDRARSDGRLPPLAPAAGWGSPPRF